MFGQNRISRFCPVFCIVGAMTAFATLSTAQQISISRIDQMPDRPSPYKMRNWKTVAAGYDSLVFNLSATGDYLPLCTIYSNTVNYPAQPSFAIPSYVGAAPGKGEAINSIPALVGASLIGIDKSAQNGRNWVLMAQEWFNNRPAENVYLNTPSGESGDDWWYEVMPNVFFYQLSSLYQGSGDFSRQSTVIADQWMTALQKMGGSTTPWNIPNINHRAWSLSTMTPNDVGVKEPEAAGAIGWIMYQAYLRTGDPKYRISAEWALESLNGLSSNPAYELQLPYGAYAAARMNAELGTQYDVAKLINWCFDVGPLRNNWGAITGRWFGYDCAGLIGEALGINDYAFAMNTFQQVGALVPLVRYDARYARAIGKWVLNAANASRLFYANGLPDDQQDGWNWTQVYDPKSVIAHEALRQYQSYTAPFVYTPGPYATGDAVKNGWAPTNLGLYGSSHVGILGGIIDTTDVPMILRLDVLKTDYGHGSAYPTYLYFNPDTIQHTVSVSLGGQPQNVYDAAAHSFVLQNVSGTVGLPIAAGSAVLAVLVPAGGTDSYDLDRYLVNGVVVDFHSGHAVTNVPPRIKALAPDSSLVFTNSSLTFYCSAADANGDSLAFQWSASAGTITGTGATVRWKAPDSAGRMIVQCVVSDGHGGEARASDTITVAVSINHPPTIHKIRGLLRKLDLGASASMGCLASDADSDSLSYSWTAISGTVTGSGAAVAWQSPFAEGNYYVCCVVSDGRGGVTQDSVAMEVRDFSKNQTGALVASYLFNSNVLDASGHGHDGTANAASYTADRFGIPSQAMLFNGTSTSVVVPNDPGLNFQNGISVSFWMKVHAFYSREQYPISHGNWQNRWKVSVSNNRVRWTIKTATGTKDLDSESSLLADSLYHVVVAYNGADIEIYVNGNLDTFAPWSGALLTTTTALTIGQNLPGVNDYCFDGVLDDIGIYDYALSLQEILTLYTPPTHVVRGEDVTIPAAFMLSQNFPNPFNPSTTIRFAVRGGVEKTPIRIDIVDILGRVVERLVDTDVTPGWHEIVWDAGQLSTGIYYCRMTTPAGTRTRKMNFLR